MAEGKTLDIGHFAARLVEVELPMGLVLDEILIQGEGVHVQGKPFSIRLKEAGNMEVRVSEASLVAFLNRKSPGGLSAFRVDYGEDGLINVGAQANIIIPLNVGAVCKLRIEENTKLFVDLVRVDAIGGAGAQNIVQRQLDNINPILDTADLPLDARLLTVSTEGEWLLIRGSIAPRNEGL